MTRVTHLAKNLLAMAYSCESEHTETFGKVQGTFGQAWKP